jgi:starch phosphorylase
MFPEYRVHAITNGVHAATWLSEPFQKLFDKEIRDWRHDNQYFRSAYGIDAAVIDATHARGKQRLFDTVKSRNGIELDPNVLTLGFARRVATYKRANLMFTDPERLVRIAEAAGGLQIVYAGKAHPQDEPGKQLIREVVEKAHTLNNDLLQIVYLENYAWDLGALLTSGVDVWVNTPKRPYEASGTSGMKAALNGVPSLSILDGWWIEGCIEGVTGWAIEDGATDNDEALSLYHKLESAVVPLYLRAPEKWAQLMRTTLAFNGSYFNTNRMVKQYTRNAYYPLRLVENPTVEEPAYVEAAVQRR